MRSKASLACSRGQAMRVATPCTRLDEKRDSILRKSLMPNHYMFFPLIVFESRSAAGSKTTGVLTIFHRSPFLSKNQKCPARDVCLGRPLSARFEPRGKAQTVAKSNGATERSTDWRRAALGSEDEAVHEEGLVDDGKGKRGDGAAEGNPSNTHVAWHVRRLHG